MRFEILFVSFFLLVMCPHTVFPIVEMGRLRKSSDPRIFINLVVMPVIREGEDEDPRMPKADSKLVEQLSPVIAFQNRFSGPKEVEIESASASLTSSEDNESPAPGIVNPMPRWTEKCRDGQFWDRELEECVRVGVQKRRGRRQN